MSEVVHIGRISVSDDPQWCFSGPWTKDEIAVIEPFLQSEFQRLYDVDGIIGNNYWRLDKYVFGDHVKFSAWRSTWQTGSCHGDTAQKCLDKIKAHYDAIYGERKG